MISMKHTMHLTSARLRTQLFSLISNRMISTGLNCYTNGLVLGVYTQESNGDDLGSSIGNYDAGTLYFNELDAKWDNKISDMLQHAGKVKCGSVKTLFNVIPGYSVVNVVGLGPQSACKNQQEGLDEKNEHIRCAISAGIKALSESGIKKVTVDVTERPTAAAEGAYLAAWNYKQSDRKKLPSEIQPSQNDPKWEEGKVLAECQNFARHLMESPANIMTPSHFANNAMETFEQTSASVQIFNKEWIKQERMEAFLSVAKGSAEEPKFLKIEYKSPGSKATNPLVLVGKGVTFDSGGISIKPSQAMDEMRADMGGAATVTSSILAAAKLNLNVHVVGLVPLCENMPSSTATKPGDVVIARDGSTIQIDNTDAEGRLLLADALNYAQDLNPSAVINVATLTGGIMVALGGAAAGVFSNDDELWMKLNRAAEDTGDRVWRMPLFKFYSHQVKPAQTADINNVGRAGRGGSACTAAAFLHHFIKKGTKWMHMDIAGTMKNNEKDVPYLGGGMSGRPTRTLAKFMYNYGKT